MKLIIVCGNEDCRKEYETNTDDRWRECPHCGRSSENTFYPFLTAVYMQSRIEGDGANWELAYDEAYGKAEVKVQERMVRLRRLESDLDVPEGERFEDPLKDIEALKLEDACDNSEWRRRHERLVEEARKVLLPIEDRIKELEEEKEERGKASKKGD